MPLVTGATAAGFRIVRLLGVGAIGEVYLAEHPRLPRRYALTILPTDVSADPEYREQFNRESDLAAALWHPHIVGLHDRGEFEGRLWISLDYVDGADAAQLLSDTYPDGMPPDEVVEIVTAIADALDYAHDHGLLHRHVKPGNILITQPASDKRRILLADFGVARRLDGINGLTQANLTVGTVSYAAPEQLMGGSIDGRTDQYALAGTAFHLLTGSPPFAHTNPAVVISKHLNEPPPRPGDVRPELADFDEPISRALAKLSTDRFPRCQDFAKALGANRSKHPNHHDAGATAVVTRPVPAPPPAATPPPDAETDTGAPTEPIAATLQDAETGAVVLTEPIAADLPDAGAAAVALAEPAAPAPPDAEADDAVYPPDVPPDAEADDAVYPPDSPPDAGIGDAFTPQEPAVSGATADHKSVMSLGRSLPRAATIVLAIAVVLIGFFVVMVLRSRSWSQLPPTNVETPSSVTTTPPALPAPATAIPPPTTTAPAPETTTSPPTTAPPSSPAPTTTTPPLSTSPPETTMPPTTSSASPPTTPPPGLDSRPALGMPCGPQQAGTTTISNSGVPVSCVGTPGGFAWEPAGG